jgi:hypothetical protein
MDLEKAIRELYLLKQNLERAIANLEELSRVAGGSPAVSREPKRRGRKHMGELERKEVSERMKAYWEKKLRIQQSAIVYYGRLLAALKPGS